MTCLVCQEPKPYSEHLTCGKELCIFTANSFNCNDNFVANFYRKQPEVAQFILQLACKAIIAQSPSYLYPAYLGISADTSKQVLDDAIRSSSVLQSILQHLSSNQCVSDQQIEDLFGSILYGWIRCTLKSNFYRLSLVDIFKNPDITTFQVEHATATSLTEQAATDYFFHGSQISNWSSIISRGLKNYSGTALQKNGAACGKGIYLASHSAYSLTYSITYGGKSVLGVFQIIGDYRQWAHRDFYVIPDESRVRLCYLIYGSKLPSYSDLIDKAFHTAIVQEKKQQIVRLRAIKNKRLLRDLAICQAQLPQHNIDFADAPTDIRHWTLYFNTSAVVSRDKIRVVIDFPEVYPMEPPFFFLPDYNLKSPFEFITEGGAICFSDILPDNWAPSTSFLELLFHIQTILIDSQSYLLEYTQRDNGLREPSTNTETAKAGFKKMLVL